MLTHEDMVAIADIIAKKVKAEIMADMTPGKWLTIEEAKTYAKVRSINTIKNWIDHGYIDGSKTSGQWRIDRESIDDWFRSGII